MKTISGFALPLLMLFSSACTTTIDKYGLGKVALDSQASADSSEIILPENAPSISQGFKPEGRMDNESELSGHNGIDILSYVGTPVIAPASGQVSKAYYDVMYGNQLEIEHGMDEAGIRTITRYFHLETFIVEVGQQVNRGQQLGELGMTGLMAPYPHLHFEVHQYIVRIQPQYTSQSRTTRLTPVNPHLFWVNGPGRVTCFNVNQDWPESGFSTTYPVPCLNTDWQ